MQSFINPADIEPTGAVAGATLVAMSKNKRNRTHVILYCQDKQEDAAYSVHTVEHNGRTLCDGSYSMDFTTAVIVFARRTAHKPNIHLVD